MSFLRRHRRYGELRLPVDRRRHERVSWLGRDLRTRRSELLRSRWRDLAVLLSALALSATGFTVVVRHSPFLAGLVLGIYAGAIAVFALVFLSVVDGTFHPRLGRAVERGVGTDLRRVPDSYGVISGISFEHVDVDHVLLTPHGCFAVEVKSSFSGRRDLGKVWDLAGKVAQARSGAKRVQQLLRSQGVDLPVTPILLFAGPGAPVMPHVVRHYDVTITRTADPSSWSGGVLRAGDSLDLETARRVADALLAYRDERTRYEQTALAAAG